MHELVLNLHIHTRYSDGHELHSQISQAALDANLDAILFTDHNVWVNGLNGYYRVGKKKVLVMVGEEIHNQARDPQKNHLLVFGADRELATLAADPQRLIDRVNKLNGLSFIAHPFEVELRSFGEDDISWVDWQVEGFTGIEIWNSMSEFKSVIKSRLHAFFYAFFPQFIAVGPPPQTLKKWDELMAAGKQVVAIGGSDSHALPMSLGPIRRIIFPYLFHFRCINTHILTADPLSGDSNADQKMILDALKSGHVFIGYDYPASTKGFRFSANTKDGIYWMGDEVSARAGVTFQVRLPFKTECRLLQNGKIIRTWQDREFCTYITSEPGVYRVEAYLLYLGMNRAWIFSNPIYVRD
jgi:hypothetical protein